MRKFTIDIPARREYILIAMIIPAERDMHTLRRKKNDTIMTDGSIAGHLIKFSLPLMVGYIFQQLYNTVDTFIVGRYVSMQALAAVGSTGSAIYTLIGFFMGFSVGAGVVISQHFGAREDEKVHEAVHTAMCLAVIFGVVFTAAGYFGAPLMLSLMRTPADVYSDALTYMRVYFSGSLGLLIYNLGSGILNAVGDSRHPLVFLVISAVINTCLDLLFVIKFHWGIVGVGLATVIAELVSALCVLFTLTRSRESYRLELKKLKIYKPVLKRIVQIGLPSSLQQMLVSFSNVFVQSYINAFQTPCIAGWASYTKIDAFTAVPQQAISLAATTFVGQNIGAGKPERAKKGTFTALMLSIAAVVLIVIPLELFAEPLIRIFIDEKAGPDAVEYGVAFLRAIAPLNLCLVGNSVLAGALRGVGDTKIPTLIQIASFIVIRQIYLAIISGATDSPLLVGLGYPLGWLCASTALIFYYFFSGWEKRTARKTPETA